MTRTLTALAALAIALPLLAGCTTPLAASSPAAAVLDAARTAAAGVDTPAKAWAAGYRPTPECVPGMGVHWLRQDLLDGALDPARPEAVLFEPDNANLPDTAGDHFLGVEYIVVTQGTAMNRSGAVPTLLGVPLQGPMPGHFPGMPWHAELHVFLDPRHPSDSTFPEESPAVVCPHGDPSEPVVGRRITFTAEDYAFDGPATAEAGWVELALENRGTEWHHLFLFRLEGDRTLAEFRQAMDAAEGEGARPAWVRYAPGPNAAEPGRTTVATVALEPGTYVVTCIIPDAEGRPHFAHGMVRELRVLPADEPTAAPTADLVVDLVDFGFQTEAPLRAGTRVLGFRNEGTLGHEAVLVRLPGEATVEQFLGSKGPADSAAELVGGITGLEPGEAAFATVDLQPGRYAYICFLSDGGDAPHFTKGMVREFTVAPA